MVFKTLKWVVFQITEGIKEMSESFISLKLIVTEIRKANKGRETEYKRSKRKAGQVSHLRNQDTKHFKDYRLIK